MRLQDKVALISGGARGMGAVEARLFARQGNQQVGKQFWANIVGWEVTEILY